MRAILCIFISKICEETETGVSIIDVSFKESIVLSKTCSLWLVELIYKFLYSFPYWFIRFWNSCSYWVVRRVVCISHDCWEQAWWFDCWGLGSNDVFGGRRWEIVTLEAMRCLLSNIANQKLCQMLGLWADYCSQIL